MSSPCHVPDITDLESSSVGEKEDQLAAEGLFGRGWLPPEERGKLISEPEAEEEALGWEVVATATSKCSRSSSFSESGSHLDKARSDGVPEDLIMGCLDSSCSRLFGPNEKSRCSGCGFFFCPRHLKGPWYVNYFGNGTPLLETHLPKPGQVFLCSSCHQRLPLGEKGFEPQHLALEVQMMKATVLKPEEEMLEGIPFPLVRSAARALLLRLLEQLRHGSRNWSEAEKEWVWSLAPELVEQDVGWLTQLFRQTQWTKEETTLCLDLLAKVHASLAGWEALQILSLLGRSAGPACKLLGAGGERKVGLAAVHAAEALKALNPTEITCCLELLLDTAQEFANSDCQGGCRAVLSALRHQTAQESMAARAFRNEYFWALETRVQALAHYRQRGIENHGSAPYAESWQSLAQQELLRNLPQEAELGLLRQHAWVRHMERGDYECCKHEPAWGEDRSFPLAVWPPYRTCAGLETAPRKAESKSAPLIVRCRYRDEPSRGKTKSGKVKLPERRKTSGVLLKKDPDMHKEQQVGQTLRLLEILIWKDPKLQELLNSEGLSFEDVRATYIIAMTGPNTAMLEFIDGARTLKYVRSGRLDGGSAPFGPKYFMTNGEKGTLKTFLRLNNNRDDFAKSLARLAFTSAISAVLSFVAGLGDRHHENFMVTVDGRLVHVDFGYALGKEPLDSMLIHFAVQGGRPATTIQYDELIEAVTDELMERIFWPVVCRAYLCVRKYPGLLVEMFYTAMLRTPRSALKGHWQQNASLWQEAQRFVARNCAAGMSEPSAERFIYSLLQHCTRMERGAQLRDELKGLRLGEKTTQAVSKAWTVAKTTSRNAAHEVIAVGPEAWQQLQQKASSAASTALEGTKRLFS
ncbi:5-bisphosphate 3-kinase 110 kDa catalytic subunit beta) (PtdIns-3-kinase subunit p110-beta) (p110beta) [Durusdinium trenchii]|uniref:5-bisphosphate 3-kinase 110 kDa catalytic subunit beta (PtdIns-3-kinase subunit p110-beta (p110beta n=1 Tax=Durusdinium trenchii TaxID=1381693 RepID=A0ABP0R6B2_9DINO